MEFQNGIELIYYGKNRRVDIQRAEYFLSLLPLKVDLPYSLSSKPKSATLAIKVTSGDIIIRPVNGDVEYHNLEKLPENGCFVSFICMGGRNDLSENRNDPHIKIRENKQGGLHLILYGSPSKVV